MNFHQMMTETHCSASDSSHVPDVVYGNIARYSELVPLDSFLSCGAYWVEMEQEGPRCLMDEQWPRLCFLTSTLLKWEKRLLEQRVHIFKCITLFHKLLGVWKLFCEAVDTTQESPLKMKSKWHFLCSIKCKHVNVMKCKHVLPSEMHYYVTLFMQNFTLGSLRFIKIDGNACSRLSGS